MAIKFNPISGQFDEVSPASNGDMTKAVYDPSNVNGDTFDMDNMAEGSTNKILTQAERDAITDNSAKVTNATHTGEVTGNGALALAAVAISNKTAIGSLAGTEEVLINAGGTLRKTTVQNIVDLAGGGGGGGAMELISSGTLANEGFDLNNISQDYNHLKLFFRGLTNHTGQDNALITFNNVNTNANYITQIDGARGTSEEGINYEVNQPGLYGRAMLNNYSTSIIPAVNQMNRGLFEMFIYDYKNTTDGIINVTGQYNSRFNSDPYVQTFSGSFKNSAPISRITITPVVATQFVQGSYFLYGIT